MASDPHNMQSKDAAQAIVSMQEEIATIVIAIPEFARSGGVIDENTENALLRLGGMNYRKFVHDPDSRAEITAAASTLLDFPPTQRNLNIIEGLELLQQQAQELTSLSENLAGSGTLNTTALARTHYFQGVANEIDTLYKSSPMAFEPPPLPSSVVAVGKGGDGKEETILEKLALQPPPPWTPLSEADQAALIAKADLGRARYLPRDFLDRAGEHAARQLQDPQAQRLRRMVELPTPSGGIKR